MPEVSSIQIIIKELEDLLFDHEVKKDQRAESRMQNIEEKELRFLTVIYPRTEPLLKQLGEGNIVKGAEKVLETLKQYIVEQIEALPKGKGTGKLALFHLKHRKKVTGDLAVYHTALRALLDRENTIGYPSLLHEDSKVLLKIGGETFPARVVLACLWLIASHPELNKEKDLADAKVNFISTLANDIRRGHNSNVKGDYPPDLEFDAPTCGLGTVTELLKRSIQLNKLVDEKEFSCQQFPEEIINFVYELFEKTVYTVRIAAFNFICSKLGLSESLSEEHLIKYEEFIHEISNQKNIAEIVFRLTNKLNYKITDELYNLFVNKIIEIVHIIQNDLTFKNNIAKSSISFYKILNICVSSLQKQKIGEYLSEKVIDSFIIAKELLNKTALAKVLCENDLRKSLLFFNYPKSDNAQITKENLKNLNNILLQQLKKHAPKLEPYLENVMKEVEQNIADEYSHEFDIKNRIKLEISTDIELINAKYKTIEQMLSDAEALLSVPYEHSSITQIAHLLSKAPLQKELILDTTNVMAWVYAIANIIFAMDENGNLIKDRTELEQFLELTYLTFPEKQAQETLHAKLQEYFKEVTKLDRTVLQSLGLNKSQVLISIIFLEDVCYYLAKQLGQQSYFSFNDSEYEGIINVSSLQADYTFFELANEIKNIFEFTQDEISEMDSYARKRIYIEKFEESTPDVEWQNNYNNWKEYATKICGREECSPMSLLKLKKFSILTMFHNLGTTKTLKINVQTIEHWCNLYLTQTTKHQLMSSSSYASDTLAFPVSEKTTMQQCIASLAGHLACVLTRFNLLVSNKEDKKVGINSGLFDNGYICFMSSEYAEEILKNCSYTRAMIVRISNSNPHKMAVSFKCSNKINKLFALLGDKPIRKAKIEGVQFTFEVATDQQLFKTFSAKNDLAYSVIIPKQDKTPTALVGVKINEMNSTTRQAYVHLCNAVSKPAESIRVGYICENKPSLGLQSNSMWSIKFKKEMNSVEQQNEEKMEIEEEKIKCDI